jgi:hypothetical protein
VQREALGGHRTQWLRGLGSAITDRNPR